MLHKPGTSLPLGALSLSQLELVRSPAQPLSAGGRLRDAGLRVWKKKSGAIAMRP